MNTLLLLAGSTAASGSNPFSGLTIILEIAVMGIAFYFILIRPQKKQQKKTEAMLSTIAAGDSVLTSSGFYGVVIDVMDEIVIIEFGNNKNCRIPVKRNAIVDIEKPNTEKNA